MRGRRAWVVLVLAGVFAMHGLECAAADAGTTAGPHGAVHAAMTPPDALTAEPDASAAVGAPLAEGRDGAPHGGGHLWAWCLAVLVAGLAALFLVLAGRPAGSRLPLPGRSPGGPPGWLRPPRPPDLYSLCLMRI